MNEDEVKDPGFRITTGVVYTAVQDVQKDITALRLEQALLSQSVTSMVSAMTLQATRIEKLEGRFNSVLVGIGVGVLTALVAVFRGVVV